MGGNGPDGQPTDTVYVAQQDLETMQLGQFLPNETLKLPEARADATLVVASDGLILIGGTNGSAIQPTVWKATVDKNGKLAAWAPQAPMPGGLSQSSSAIVGDFVFVYGGRDANGPTNAVYRGSVEQGRRDARPGHGLGGPHRGQGGDDRAAGTSRPGGRVQRERRALPRRWRGLDRPAAADVLDRPRSEG